MLVYCEQPSATPNKQSMRDSSSTAAALFLGCTVAALSGMASPVQWAGNGHWYEVFYAPGISWPDAQAAVTSGGYLATLTSSEEDAFVRGLLQANPSRFEEVWAGGFQPAGELVATANWTWVNGEGAFPGHNDDPSGYANWTSNEPNDNYGPGSEQYLGIYWSGNRWNDEGALGNISGYVVEYNRTPDAGSTLSLLGLGMIGLAALRRRLS